MRRSGQQHCHHCGFPVPRSRNDGFCCAGCHRVHDLLKAKGFDAYYALRSGRGLPVAAPRSDPSPPLWLEALEEQIQQPTDQTPDAGASGVHTQRAAALEFDVQGLHCSACVWLIETSFHRNPGSLAITINPARASATVRVSPAFPLVTWYRELVELGYGLAHANSASASAGSQEDHEQRSLVLRTGVCGALAANASIFSAALYFGLDEGPVYELTRALLVVFAALASWLGGSLFFRRACLALRRRRLGLDIPIALGIAIAFSASLVGYTTRVEELFFADSVTVFVFLMLVGQLLRSMVVRRNRTRLASMEAHPGTYARRLTGQSQPTIVPTDRLRPGDAILVAAGEVVPATGRLLSAHAELDLAWRTGESEAVPVTRHAEVQEGSINKGPLALELEVTTSAPGEALQRQLVEAANLDSEQGDEAATARGLAQPSAAWLNSAYTLCVLLAALGIGLWSLAQGLGAWVAANRMVAALVVTCPCALGIAMPLAQQLMHQWLVSRGLLLRRPDVLERLRSIRHVVFDKTGTLTEPSIEHSGRNTENPSHNTENATRNTARLEQSNSAIAALEPKALQVLVTMVNQSAHPKSRALGEWLRRQPLELPPLLGDLQVEELPGCGLQARWQAKRYRLGKAIWALQGSGAPNKPCAGQDAEITDEQGTVFSGNGQPLALLELEEALRPGVKEDFVALDAAGFDVWILSGDQPQRVQRTAERLGLRHSRALSAQSPLEKRRWLERLGVSQTLFVGDGLNDAPGLGAAAVSLTPNIGTPVVATCADGYYLTAGLRPVRDLFAAGRFLQTLQRGQLAYAAVYNAGAVALAALGLIKPWTAAIIMPASSIGLLLATQGMFAWWARPPKMGSMTR